MRVLSNLLLVVVLFAFCYGQVACRKLPHESHDVLRMRHARSATHTDAESSCKADEDTYKTCSLSRKDAINCIFENFATPDNQDEVPVSVLEDAWVRLLNPAQRRIAGSVENVINACNPDHDAVFSRRKMMRNKCHCIENCTWATRVRIVCNLAKQHPDWRNNPIS